MATLAPAILAHNLTLRISALSMLPLPPSALCLRASHGEFSRTHVANCNRHCSLPVAFSLRALQILIASQEVPARSRQLHEAAGTPRRIEVLLDLRRRKDHVSMCAGTMEGGRETEGNASTKLVCVDARGQWSSRPSDWRARWSSSPSARCWRHRGPSLCIPLRAAAAAGDGRRSRHAKEWHEALVQQRAAWRSSRPRSDLYAKFSINV
eukprot:SAG31_NODE_505_length_14757_cov_20.172943_2_plen_209_part_00